MVSGNRERHIETEAPRYDWPHGVYSASRVSSTGSRPSLNTLSSVLLSVLCSGEDLELRISRDLDDLESRMRPTLVQPGYSHA